MKRWPILLWGFFILLFSGSHCWATQDPPGVTLDSLVFYHKAKVAYGGMLGVIIPKPFVPNLGVSDIYLSLPSEIKLEAESTSLKVKFDARLHATFFDFFWLLPTRNFWAIGAGFGRAQVSFDKVIATSSVSDQRLSEFETDLKNQKSVIRGQHVFTRLAIWSGDFWDLHTGLHHVSFETLEASTGTLKDELDTFSGNMATLGLGFFW